MELYFIRHGETNYNKHHQLMGQRVDAPLDEAGLAQAHQVIEKIPSDIAVVFSSPLQRAKITAQMIADHFGKELIIKQELIERDFGTLSGKTWEEIDKETGLSLSERDEKLDYDYEPFGGESVFSVKTRLEKFLEEVQANFPEQKIAVVTHYGIISIMNSLFHIKEHHTLTNVSVHKYEL